MDTPPAKVVAQLAPTGVLRAGINLSNFLLVTGRTDAGDPVGVSPDMAAEVAKRLGVPLVLVPFESPGLVADAVGTGRWDIALIGAEPQRAETIRFSPAYVEIEATYLVPSGSPIRTIDEVDRPGVRIAVSERSAYGLWLQRNLVHATLVAGGSIQGSLDAFVDGGLEALAGLRTRLLQDVQTVAGSRILDGKFSSVQQAIGTEPDRVEGAAFLRDFVESAKASGLVAAAIARHRVEGLSVAPPDPGGPGNEAQG
ncbi:MAG: transporter substrate-binding domain-containing protein [Lautropia sp.]